MYTLNFETKSILSDRAWLNLESSSIFSSVFLGSGYKITEKPRIPSDNLDPTSTFALFQDMVRPGLEPSTESLQCRLSVWLYICSISGHGQARPGVQHRVSPLLCLSVCPSDSTLNYFRTWSGPAWSPAQSLSSVLISIQSLMNEKPYHNEPGFERVHTAFVLRTTVHPVLFARFLFSRNFASQQPRENKILANIIVI